MGLCRQEALGFYSLSLRVHSWEKGPFLAHPCFLSWVSVWWFLQGRHFSSWTEPPAKKYFLTHFIAQTVFSTKNGSAMTNYSPLMAIHQKNSQVWWVQARWFVCLRSRCSGLGDGNRSARGRTAQLLLWLRQPGHARGSCVLLMCNKRGSSLLFHRNTFLKLHWNFLWLFVCFNIGFRAALGWDINISLSLRILTLFSRLF